MPHSQPGPSILSALNPPSPQSPQQMVHFLDHLFSKYKVLDKLTTSQSDLFQSQVIELLVDENKNVDAQAYAEITNTIGLDAFVLEVLAKCVNRSPFGNQYQMRKNMGVIAEGLEKQARESQKRARVLEKREAEVLRLEQGVKMRVKEFMAGLEKELAGKLMAKQNEVRKNIGNMMNGLKLKQKILVDRKEEIVRKSAQLEERCKNQSKTTCMPKSKEEHIRNQMIQAQKIGSQAELEQARRQLKQLNTRMQNLKQELEKLKKKNRTTQMAYSKLKSDLAEKQKIIDNLQQKHQLVKEELLSERAKFREERQRLQRQIKNLLSKDAQQSIDTNNRPQYGKQNNLVDMLQMLQISTIEAGNQQGIPVSYHQESKNEKNVSLKQFKRMQKARLGHGLQADSNTRKNQPIYRQQENQQQLSPRPTRKIQGPLQISNKISESFVYSPQILNPSLSPIPKFLSQTQPSTSTQLLAAIHSCLSSSAPSQLLTSDLLHKFILLPSYQLTKNSLNNFYDILLQLVQQNNLNYYQCLQYLSQPAFVQFFQRTYLNHESSLPIAQASTLLISRILMVTQSSIKFDQQFLKAIKIRPSIRQAGVGLEEQEDEFLLANINCILSMVPL